MASVRPNLRFIFAASARPSSLPSSSSPTKFTVSTTSCSDHYGPSISRGQRPIPPDSSSDASDSDYNPHFSRSSFSRTFYIAALRIPASECSSIEVRLRGHLLNWPRIRNVARVFGDDLESDIQDTEEDGGQRLLSIACLSDGESDVRKEVLRSVMYREKLAKEFNRRGFLNFRNLARISRPRKKKNATGNGDMIRVKVLNKEYEVVEIVGEKEGVNDDMRHWIGDEFRDGSWRGGTRLLLLDERHADKGFEELPEAVKAVLKGGNLTQCQLTLFYNYWHMNEILEALLPEDIVVPSGFETVGHIAHLNLGEEHLPYKELIAQVVLDKNMPKIRTVVNKVNAIKDDYRTMQLEILAGNLSLATNVIETGIKFQIDLGKVYWNSRLAAERQRLIRCFASSDVVCDVFSGAGPIAIFAAKKVKYVYANDLNPYAVEFLERNIALNKLDRKIEVFNMDGVSFIESLFASQRTYPVTQVVMNLPEKAVEYLAAFHGILRRRARADMKRLPRIHVYGFSKALNPEFDFQERINLVLCETLPDVKIERIRLVAPRKWMLCASFILPQTVAFAQLKDASLDQQL